MYYQYIEHAIDNINCKFDQLMNNSVYGNCLTSLICTVSSNRDDIDGSVSTLKLALIAKKIKLMAVANFVMDAYDRLNEQNTTSVSSNVLPLTLQQ